MRHDELQLLHPRRQEALDPCQEVRSFDPKEPASAKHEGIMMTRDEIGTQRPTTTMGAIPPPVLGDATECLEASPTFSLKETYLHLLQLTVGNVEDTEGVIDSLKEIQSEIASHPGFKTNEREREYVWTQYGSWISVLEAGKR